MAHAEMADRRIGARRVWERPTLHKVPLRPEEAVLGACKTGQTAGPASSACAGPFGCSNTPGS